MKAEAKGQGRGWLFKAKTEGKKMRIRPRV